MKTILSVLGTMILAVTLGFAQNSGPATSGNASTGAATNYDGNSRPGFNWGWIGLLGLAGLAGLRRHGKSEDVRKLESRGVNVKTV